MVNLLLARSTKNALSCSRDPTCVFAFELKVSAVEVVSDRDEPSLMRVLDDLARIHSTLVETSLRDDVQPDSHLLEKAQARVRRVLTAKPRRFQHLEKATGDGS